MSRLSKWTYLSSSIFVVILGSFISRSHQASSCVPPPKARLFRLNSESDPIGVGVTQLNFNVTRTSKPSFLLSCEHNVPIHWVLDEDLTLGQISEPGASPTNRSFLDFQNTSTYLYTAKYFLELKFPSKDHKDHIFICQPFSKENNPKPKNVSGSGGSGCVNRAVVLAELQFTLLGSGTKKLSVGVLSPQEILQNVPPLAEFDAKLKKHALTLQNGGGLGVGCPFTLNLALGKGKELYIEWVSNTSGVENIIYTPTVQALENLNRFHPQMEEHCINVVDVASIKDKNRALHQSRHLFFPHVLTYALPNERRTLKIFFDVAEDSNFYYSWESPNPQEMIYGNVKERVVYKGQVFTVTCAPSVYLFSQGTQIAWTFPKLHPTHGQRTGFIAVSGEDFADAGGTYELRANVTFSRDFLVQHDLDEVVMTCVAPRWNDSSWVNYTIPVKLWDSELPKIFHVDGDDDVPDTNSTALIEIDGSEKEFNISCEASGIPLPTVEFIPPRNNLAFETDSRVENESRVVRTLRFENITAEIEGEYICVAKSVVGDSRRVFQVKLHQGLPEFVLIILIVGGFSVVIFVLVSSALLIKLRKEKAEFIKATEDAIKKFRDGFATSGDDLLGFKANSEYKDYEIPISRWGLGNTLLGSGAFGVVQKGIIYHGENRQDVVAVKTVNSPKDVSEFENCLMELTIMSYIGKHSHVVSLVGACTDNIGKRSILIGVEYCANGDLLNYLQKRRALFRSFVGTDDGLLSLDSICGRSSYTNFANSWTFTSLDLYKWAFQIADGMDFLASRKILHADLAARNVLLTKDNICKISDFGLSRQLLMSDNYTKKTNTPLPWRWMAIESLKYRQFSSASDIWSFGVTLFEIFTLGEEPWPKMGWTNEFQDELEKGRRLSRPKFCTNNMYNKIVLECWINEPEERITFPQAREFFETAINNLTSPEGKDDEFLNSVC